MASGFPLCQCPIAGIQHKLLLYLQPGYHTTTCLFPLTCSWCYQFEKWIFLHFPDVLFPQQLQFHNNIQHLSMSFCEPRFPTPWLQSSIFSSSDISFLKLHNVSSPSFRFISLALGLWFFMFTTFSFFFLSRRETKTTLLLSTPLTSTLSTQLFISSLGSLPLFSLPTSIHPETHAASKSKQLHQWLPTL